ncbi:MAG: Vacuolar protein sorting-associated protein 53, partial [Paramarteilia canceri]
MISWSEEVSKTESVTEFEPELHQKIAKLLNIKPDKIDSTDFEVSQYINDLFPDEKSIENIDEIYSKVTNEI